MKTIKYYGPPGTGKTSTLISTLENALKNGVAPHEIAFLSHTKAASEEMKDRVMAQLGIDRRHLVWFRTIHSACLRMIGGAGNVLGRKEYEEFSQETGFELTGNLGLDALEEDAKTNNEWDWPLHWQAVAKHRKETIQETMDRFGADDPNMDEKSRNAFFKSYRDFKLKKGMIDFDDMLDIYMNDPRPVPVKIFMVDEAQDLSKLQWDIVERMSAQCEKLYIAGDDDQSIYTFLGADEYGFLEHPADDEIVLSHSYRCAPSIGRFGMRVISNVRHRRQKEVSWNTERGEGDTELLGQFWNEFDWHDLVADGRSVMVLCPHKVQVRSALRQIESQGFPASMGGRSINDTQLAKAIYIYHRMRQRKEFRPIDAAPLFKQLRIPMKAVLERGRQDANYTVPMSDIDIDWSKQVQEQFDPQHHKYQFIDKCREIVTQHGIEALATKPQIDVSTIHAAKGREADTVIIQGDCFQKMYQAQVNNLPENYRLCYVAVTRARDRVIVLDKRSPMYLEPLMEVLNG